MNIFVFVVSHFIHYVLKNNNLIFRKKRRQDIKVAQKISNLEKKIENRTKNFDLGNSYFTKNGVLVD